MLQTGKFTGTEVIESICEGAAYWLRSPAGEYTKVTKEETEKLYATYERKVVFDSTSFGPPTNGNILRIYSLGNQIADSQE